MFAWLLTTLALGAEGSTLKTLYMPLTPNDEHRQEFHALVPEDDAGGKDWASDAAGFECIGNGDFVEVWVRAESWPAKVPKKITCTDGARKVKARVILFDRVHRSMFIANGTLVMPRQKGNSAYFKGGPPRPDFGIQQGRTGNLSILCEIVRGGNLEVTAYPTMEDGEGRCTLQTKQGEKVPFPVVIRTLKKPR